MASPVPAKSQPQPLYSFSLTGWKLTKNHTNNHHRGRRGADSSSSSQLLPANDTARRRSPLLHSVHRQSPMRDSASPSSSDYQTVKADKQQQQQQREVFDHEESRSKIYIRLKPPSKNKKAYEVVQDEANPDMEGTEVEESMAKTWNLRPRKPIRKQINLSVGKSSSPENKVQSSPSSTVLKRSERSEMRSAPQTAAAAAVVGVQKEKKRKFSISLSRDEIEEDIYALIGSKPNRRPKKRSRIVQRQLDSVFPGLWLSTITPDAYKVSEIPMKG